MMWKSACCIFLIYNKDKQLQAGASRKIHPKGQAAWEYTPEELRCGTYRHQGCEWVIGGTAQSASLGLGGCLGTSLGPWSGCPKGLSAGWGRLGHGGLGKENELLLLIHKDPEISSVGQSMVPITPK